MNAGTVAIITCTYYNEFLWADGTYIETTDLCTSTRPAIYTSDALALLYTIHGNRSSNLHVHVAVIASAEFELTTCVYMIIIRSGSGKL